MNVNIKSQSPTHNTASEADSKVEGGGEGGGGSADPPIGSDFFQ